MRVLLVALAGISLMLCGCQSNPAIAPGSRVTAADYKNAKPLTKDEEAKLLAIGERQSRLAPLHVASSLDPTGLSQNAIQAKSRADMMELNKLMPAMHATNKKRVKEFCATRQQTPECKELARLMDEARSQGVEY